MIREAINRILELKETEILEIGEHTYSTKGLNLVTPPRPDFLKLSSLDSLVDLMLNSEENDERYPEIVVVVSPTKVVVESILTPDRNRETYYICEAKVPCFPFDTFMDVEPFNIALQSKFVANEDREKVLKVVGNIRSEQVQTVDDDGVSQQVEVRAGIARTANVIIPNPVMLRPYRTFTEIEQPESAFVLRMKDGPTAALFEADGGAWEREAVKRIQRYLQNKLQHAKFLVIA